MTAQTSLPPLLRALRLLALLQYSLSGVAFLVTLGFCFLSLDSTHDLAFVTLELNAASRGQLTAERADSLQASRAQHPHCLVDKSSQKRFIYREPSAGKRLVLALLGVTNSSLGRSSLALLLFSMLTGRLFYRILRDMSLATPFTARNAQRIRWLALLFIGIDVYEWVATGILRAVVPALALGGHGADTLTRFIVLDPTLGSVGSWKFGLLLLVIATIYKRGVEMAHEAELTI